MKQTLKTEVPQVFYECFMKAISECLCDGHKIDIVKEEKIKDSNAWIITVETTFAENFFYLGKKYAVYRNEL